MAPGFMRHVQFPAVVDGVLIRASGPRSSQSCMGMTAVSATEARAMRVMTPDTLPAVTSHPR